MATRSITIPAEDSHILESILDFEKITFTKKDLLSSVYFPNQNGKKSMMYLIECNDTLLFYMGTQFANEKTNGNSRIQSSSSGELQKTTK